MRSVYAASIIWRGILGGGIIVESDKMTYKTGKLLLPENIKNLEMPYSIIKEITAGYFLCFPIIDVVLPTEHYKFIVFNRRRLLKQIHHLSPKLPISKG